MTKAKNSKKDETSKKDVSDKSQQKQSSTRKSGQSKQSSVTLGEAKKTLEKHGLVLDDKKKGKRIYRRSKDRPDPKQSSQAEVNLTSAKLTPRVSREHVDLFNACVKGFGSKRKALERAVELLAKDVGIDFE